MTLTGGAKPRLEEEVADNVKPTPALAASISINGNTVDETVYVGDNCASKNAENSECN